MRIIRWMLAVIGLAVAAPVLAITGLIASRYLEPKICDASDRITTPEAALEFGKRHFRADLKFALRINMESQEREYILQEKNCCAATKGDWRSDDNSKWDVRIRGQLLKGNAFDYDVFFTECGKGLHTYIETH